MHKTVLLSYVNSSFFFDMKPMCMWHWLRSACSFFVYQVINWYSASTCSSACPEHSKSLISRLKAGRVHRPFCSWGSDDCHQRIFCYFLACKYMFVCEILNNMKMTWTNKAHFFPLWHHTHGGSKVGVKGMGKWCNTRISKWVLWCSVFNMLC